MTTENNHENCCKNGACELPQVNLKTVGDDNIMKSVAKDLEQEDPDNGEDIIKDAISKL